MNNDTTAQASTAEAVAAQVASRDEGDTRAGSAAAVVGGGEGRRYEVGDGVRRATTVAPYQRGKGDPLYRPLRIYTTDPSASRLDAAVATVNVAWEPLEPGPVGKLFEVDNRDAGLGLSYRAADLDDPGVLIADGHDPSPSDPRFHQQMVYAVCSNVYASFRAALGRNLGWGFGDADRPARLRLRPHYGHEQNAYYVNEGRCGELRFGYYRAAAQCSNRTLPGGFVFTCLSHDIVVHEVTHALLDGLRANFLVPTTPDVPAFHEAFADLVAIFQHFSYPEVVLLALRRCRGALNESDLLTQLAAQFGHTSGRGGPLRSAIERPQEEPRQYSDTLEAHALGEVLVSAVFQAFVTVFERKTERFLRLATGGSGVLPPGELQHDLQALLADRASRLASQFLRICIRAIDYCPPVGLSFGDYLRALITADADLVPDDRWDYRGALIDAFWRRNIYPRSASNLSEDALRWNCPRIPLPPVPGLDFAALRFKGDPAHAADVDEAHRQACSLGEFISQPQHLEEFGLVANGDARLDGDTVSLPRVESIRSARRAGPDGQIVFDLVAEITQRRQVRASGAGPAFEYHGGSTVILDPNGDVRFVVLKSVTGHERLKRRRDFIAGERGRPYWEAVGDRYQPRPNWLALLHGP